MSTAVDLTPLLTEQEAAAYLGLKRVALLREWRSLDKQDDGDRGPKPQKVGRLVRYRLSEIDAWLERQNQK